MSAFGIAAVAAARARGAILRARARNPRPSQERALSHLMHRAKDTAFGLAHDFAGVRSPSDFRERVPLRTYADVAHWFERALNGEANVTWPGKIQYFGWSSGTTAGNKHLPVSMDSVRQQQIGGFDVLANYFQWTQDTTLFDAKAIMVGGSSELKRYPSGVLVGDNTGIMIHHVPWWMQRSYLPTPEIRRIGDWDKKIEATVREAVDQDVRLLAGTPSWFPGIFDQVLAEARRRGRKADSIFDVWPNFRVITGGGISYEPYRPLIEARLGKRVPYVDSYNATEGGVMGVQDQRDETPMLLLPDNGIYYEFVPLAELDSVAPRRLSLWEVEPNVTYALVVNTMSGIFGYLIGDCLRFVETFPHRFHFEGRTAAFLNLAGEHISQGEIERAVRAACSKTGCEVVDFTVAGEAGVAGGASSRHIWFVEFGGAAPDLDVFASLLDADIRALNGDYDAHRSNTGLQMPLVRAVPRGTFHEWMRERGKLGGQNKVPRVVVDGKARDLLASVADRLS